MYLDSADCRARRISRVGHSITGVIGLMAFSSALAVTDAEPVITSPVMMLVRLVGALCLVLLIFWISVKVIGRAQRLSRSAPGALKIIDSLSVGQRERIVVLQAGAEQLVLGVTATQISVLHTLAEPLDLPSTDHAKQLRGQFGKLLERERQPS